MKLFVDNVVEFSVVKWEVEYGIKWLSLSGGNEGKLGMNVNEWFRLLMRENVLQAIEIQIG